MRYINLHFTYLLTYLLNQFRTKTRDLLFTHTRPGLRALCYRQ